MEWPEQSRNDLFEKRREQSVKICAWSLCVALLPHASLHHASEHFLPGVGPGDVSRLVPIVGYSVEAELSIGRVRDTVAVHLCQGSAEFLHIRQLFDHIDVVAKAEVHVWVR